MEFDTIPSDAMTFEELLLVLGIGLAVTLVLFLIGLTIYSFVLTHGIWYLLKLAVGMIVGLPGVWILGYMTIRILSGRAHKCKCGYSYNYFFTEYWHKKNCLSYVVNPK